MKRIGSFLSVVLAASAIGQAAKTVDIAFANEGDREVWIGSVLSPGDFVKPQSAQGTSISLAVPDKPEGLSVFVHNIATGNVASRAIADIIKARSWKLDPKDETRVRAMEFIVTFDGKPVASAVVRAKAGSESRQALLTPGDRGKAVVYNLPVGTVQVTVDYKAESGSKSTPAQAFEAKLGAGPAKPKSIIVPEKVEVVQDEPVKAAEATTKTAETKAEPKPDTAPPPNPLVSFLNLLLGLAVIGGITYGLYTYVKKNPKQFEDTLKKVGLAQIEPPADHVPATPAQPQPIKPIMLDNSTPTAVVSAPMSTAVKNPRLVKSDGSVALLQEGRNTVGRDDGLPVSLAGESSVSRQHASLEKSGDVVKVTDLGSTNGTFVNGAMLNGEVVLQPGDNVQFGAVAFRFEV